MHKGRGLEKERHATHTHTEICGWEGKNFNADMHAKEWRRYAATHVRSMYRHRRGKWHGRLLKAAFKHIKYAHKHPQARQRAKSLYTLVMHQSFLKKKDEVGNGI